MKAVGRIAGARRHVDAVNGLNGHDVVQQQRLGVLLSLVEMVGAGLAGVEIAHHGELQRILLVGSVLLIDRSAAVIHARMRKAHGVTQLVDHRHVGVVAERRLGIQRIAAVDDGIAAEIGARQIGRSGPDLSQIEHSDVGSLARACVRELNIRDVRKKCERVLGRRDLRQRKTGKVKAGEVVGWQRERKTVGDGARRPRARRQHAQHFFRRINGCIRHPRSSQVPFCVDGRHRFGRAKNGSVAGRLSVFAFPVKIERSSAIRGNDARPRLPREPPRWD